MEASFLEFIFGSLPLQVTRGKSSYCFKAREQKLNSITSLDVLTLWHPDLSFPNSITLLHQSVTLRGRKRWPYSPWLYISEWEVETYLPNAKQLDMWIHPDVSLLYSIFSQMFGITETTPNVSKKSFKNIMTLQIGKMGTQRPSKI